MVAVIGQKPEVQEGSHSQEISVSSVGKGVAWNALASVSPQLLSLVLSIAVGRILGPAEQGIQSFMIFVAATASVVCALGLPLALQRSLSDSLGGNRLRQSNYLVNWSLKLSIVPALLAVAVTLIVSRLYEPGRWLDWLAVIVYAGAATVHSVGSQALLGMRQYRAASVIGLLGQVIGVPLTIVLLLNGAGITAVVMVVAVTAVFSAIITIFLLYRALGRIGALKLPALAAPERRKLRRGLLIFASGSGALVLLDTVVMQRSELAFLTFFHGNQPEHLAFYNVAYNAGQVAVRLPLALIPVILPTVSTLAAAGLIAKVRRGYVGAQRIMFVISAIAAGLLLAGGTSAIVVFWGEIYRPAGQVLLISAVLPVLIGPMSAMVSATMLGLGRLRVVVKAQAVGAAATLFLDLVLIKPFEIYGAAVANSLGQLVVVVVLLRTAKKAEGLALPKAREIGNAIVLMLLIALPGLALLLLDVPPLASLLGGVSAGLLVLALVLPILKPLNADDVGMAATVLARLPGPVQKWISSGIARDAGQKIQKNRELSAGVEKNEGTNAMTDKGDTGAGTTSEAAEQPLAAPANNGSGSENSSLKRSFFRRSWPLVVFLIAGLGLGLLAGSVASGMQKSSYVVSSTYALIPGTAGPNQADGAPATRPPAESGQLALLTPVVAAVVSDPATKAAADQNLGRSLTATVMPRVIPNSPLLFSVQVDAGSPEETLAVAQAYEAAMPQLPKVLDALGPSGAKLTVVTGAERTAQNQSLPKPLIVLGGGAVGLLAFGAIAWAYAHRRDWIRAQ